MSKNKLIILANKYPNIIEKNVNVFTQQIAWSFTENNCDCVIICPVAINYNYKNHIIPKQRVERTDSGKKIIIYSPRYIGFGQNGKFLLKLRVAFTTRAYIRAVKRALKNIDMNNSAFFAEFLCPSGVAASLLGKKYKLPSYMQIGEAIYRGDLRYGNKKLASKLIKDLSGVIAVSGQNKNALVKAGVVAEEKVFVIPSGYRRDRIFKRDKIESRKKLGLPLDKFIVGFCGSYGERKGVLRLEKAIDEIQDDEIVMAAVGKGNGAPTSKKCVLKGPIDHKDLSWFYSAIDVFAFPTYNEGCCTAIVEAIACGCPIISSDREFNYEICEKTNSILIEPDDISAMKDSIIKLKEDRELRERLSEGSIAKSQELCLDNKARKIIEIIFNK